MSSRLLRSSWANDRPPRSSQQEAVARFCHACVFFHETRAKFFPGEAPDLVPPSCFYRGTPRASGWCGGAAFQEGIP